MTDSVDRASGREVYEELIRAHGGRIADSLPDRMGIEIVAATAERVEGRMRVEGNTQPQGLLHGGASCVLAETLGSTGAALHSGPHRVVAGVEISASHHRGVSQGVVTGVATPLHLGRSLATYEVVLTDEQERRVCTARLTCMLRSRE